jgi:hypothetical protein
LVSLGIPCICHISSSPTLNTILQGDVGDHESILAALKQVDVVISTLSPTLIADQLKLIDAIKEVGHIKVMCLLMPFHIFPIVGVGVRVRVQIGEVVAKIML